MTRPLAEMPAHAFPVLKRELRYVHGDHDQRPVPVPVITRCGEKPK